MTKLTKEQLFEKLQHRIAVAAKYPDLEEAQLDAEIFKIALASLEAEPVGEFYHEKQGGWYQISEGDKVSDNRRIQLYAAPVLPKQPEPVVLYMGRKLISKEGLELIKDGVSEATQLESMCMASAILGYGHPAQPVSEPVAWRCDREETRGVVITVHKTVAESWRLKGWKVTSLIEATPAQEQK